MCAGDSRARRKPARHVRLGSEARREAILEGARRAVIAGGLERTTMDDVAEAAGVAKGTPYLYFSSKADLIESIRRAYALDLLAKGTGILDPEAGSTEPATQRLELFALSIFDYAVERQALHHVLFGDPRTSEGEQLRPVTAAVERFLTSAMASGELGPGNPSMLAHVLVAGAHAAMVPAMHRRPPDREAFLLLTRDLIRRLFH